MAGFIVRKASEMSDFPALVQAFLRLGWAEFILHDPAAEQAWPLLHAHFTDFMFAIEDQKSGTPTAIGLTVPLAWDAPAEDLPEEGWHWVLHQAADDFRRGLVPKTLSAVAAVVHPDFRGHGLASLVVREMKALAAKHGFRRVIAPLRPSQKSQHPLVSMREYAYWRREDGTPFDAWLRVHTSLGARVVKTCEKSIVLEASLDDWRKWTGLPLQKSGTFAIPHGDAPLRVGVEENLGVYVAAGIWVVHE